MIEPKILWEGTLSEGQITVEIIPDSQSNRQRDPHLENEVIPQAWGEKTVQASAEGKELYDGTSYRLEELDFRDGQLRLVVSPIKFSIRSVLKKCNELEKLGEGYYSHGLSVSGLVLTNDGKYLFAQKSSKSASSVTTDIIGGVLERIEPASGVGIFNMQRDELKEEINVNPEMIEEMEVIGLVRSSTTDIVIVTMTKLNLSSAEVLEAFSRREEFELDDVVVVDADNILKYLEELGGYKPSIGQIMKRRVASK